MRKINLTWLLFTVSTFIFTNSMEDMGHDMHDHEMHNHSKHSAKMHGPIGLMGDHFHRKGESMVSIRYMKMTMDQNYIGSHKISDQDILQLPNPYGMPEKLTVVAQEMNVDMIMLGRM